MASLVSTSQPKKLSLFLNTSFLFLLSFFAFTNVLSQSKGSTTASFIQARRALLQHPNSDNCTGIHQRADYEARCSYVKSEKACLPKGYINYLQVFYCSCGQVPVLGYAVLVIWLVLLFYLLGNTAKEYFCPSLESLSKILKLSPTIAGTTLLPLGNGVTDVFSSIISFTRSGDGAVGLNSVLGGAFFISSVVVGTISILITDHEVAVDKSSFVRDVLFFLFAISSLFFIVMVGRISLWGAVAFASIYFVYILLVSLMHFFYRKKERVVNLSTASPSSRSFLGEFGEVGVPLLGYVDEEIPISVDKADLEASDQKEGEVLIPDVESPIFVHLFWFLHLLELPLYLPRRLTIPMARDERWSKPFAVISVTLAPILIATLWNTQRKNTDAKTRSEIYITGASLGFVLGILAFSTTKKSSPPNKFLLPWITAGFLMSITWTYIIAEELVSLLVSLGHILGISPSILGLTVLAWGNSTGDMISNVALAMNGGSDGVQIAVSGCYAGPLFNTLVGLGFSLVFASWTEYPSSYVIPSDPVLLEILGFLMAGLLWALVILPKKNMKLDKSLGSGLLAIYFCFLFLRFSGALDILNL